MQWLATGASIAGTGLAYCLVEARAYTVRDIDVQLEARATTAQGMRILHISDLHLAPWDRDRGRWVAKLATLQPDVVVATGDFLAHQDSLPLVQRALNPLGAFPGVFVLGSNDYYGPRLKNPLSYLARGQRIVLGTPLPTDGLRSLLSGFGWTDLDNKSSSLNIGGVNVEVRGTGDAHINLDDYSAVAGAWAPTAQLRLSVTHAPYRRVLEPMAADEPDLILAGHTHGGQITVPFITALTTNCDLPTTQARGLSAVSVHSENPGDTGQSGRSIPLHVSAGVGTSPFFPVRLGCRPEATVLTLR